VGVIMATRKYSEYPQESSTMDDKEEEKKM
jgi:hypothetical protein